jgi:hypothetical protein
MEANVGCDKHSGDHLLGWSGRQQNGRYKTPLGQAATVYKTLHPLKACVDQNTLFQHNQRFPERRVIVVIDLAQRVVR